MYLKVLSLPMLKSLYRDKHVILLSLKQHKPAESQSNQNPQHLDKIKLHKSENIFIIIENKPRSKPITQISNIYQNSPKLNPSK